LGGTGGSIGSMISQSDSGKREVDMPSHESTQFKVQEVLKGILSCPQVLLLVPGR
jgi:hypothetical protein